METVNFLFAGSVLAGLSISSVRLMAASGLAAVTTADEANKPAFFIKLRLLFSMFQILFFWLT
jgi:hypothetical protein